MGLCARKKLHICNRDTGEAVEVELFVPKIAVPDQLRSAVSGPDRYDPEINPTYAELAEH